MRATNGDAFVKVGADGTYVSILAKRGWGVALKVHDGSQNVSEVAIFAILQHLLDLDDDQTNQMRAFSNPVMENFASLKTGKLRAVGV